MTEVERALGAVDVLVNSAGAAKRYVLEELDVAGWHDAMDAKYFSYVHAMQAVLPGMLARAGGVIINIIGNHGKVAVPAHVPSGAANAALMLVSTGLANAYGKKGIRTYCARPCAAHSAQYGLPVLRAIDAGLLSMAAPGLPGTALPRSPIPRPGRCLAKIRLR